MGVGWKKFVSKYGIMFGLIYLGTFFLLVTLYGRFEFPPLPGDIAIQNSIIKVYLPFVSSLGVATFFTVIIEVYKNFFK